MSNYIPESRFRRSYKKLIRTLLLISCLYLVYLIIFGGQYSFYSLYHSSREHRQANERNANQLKENDRVAEENYRILTDTEKKMELSNELGYKRNGEQIIKRTK